MTKRIISLSIPLKLIPLDQDGFHLMVKVKLNNKVAKLVLDTGASKTVFDKHKIAKFVKQSRFEKSEHLSTGLGTSTMESHLVNINKMAIGSILLVDFKMVLLDLSHISHSYEQLGLPAIDGVLGGDILNAYQAVINYGKKELWLSNRH